MMLVSLDESLVAEAQAGSAQAFSRLGGRHQPARRAFLRRACGDCKRWSAVMTQAADRLKALFAADEPPARAPGFSMAVMERLMRRRFQEDVAILCGVSVAGGAVLWPLWPVLQPTLVTLSQG